MKKKKIIIIGIIVLVLVGAIYFILAGSSEGIKISVIEVEKISIVKTVDMPGSIYSNDIQEIQIPPGIKVKEVYFQENELVNPGDVLALLDTRDLNLRLKKAEITLGQIDADIKNPGSKVSGPDSKILLNNIDTASELYKKSENDLKLSKDELENLKILFEGGAISEVEFDNQVSLVTDLEINLQTEKLNIKDAKLRYEDYLSQISDTKRNLAKQRQALLLDIEGIKNDIDSNLIKSEISGIITDLKLKKDRETNKDEFVRIQDLNSFKFKAMVTQEDAILIEEDQKAYITISGLPGKYEGLVSSKAKTANVDQSSGSSTPKVEITIDILNEDDFFVSGFDADAIIETGVVENVLALNNEGIKKDDNGNYFVYLVDSNSKAKKTMVETGLSDGYKTQIIAGLKLLDKVVSNPPMELVDGSALKIQ